MNKLLKTLLLAAMLFCGTSVPVYAVAQESVAEVENTDIGDELDYKQVSARLQQMEEEIKANNYTRQSLEEDLNILSEREMAIDAFIRSVEKQSK